MFPLRADAAPLMINVSDTGLPDEVTVPFQVVAPPLVRGAKVAPPSVLTLHTTVKLPLLVVELPEAAAVIVALLPEVTIVGFGGCVVTLGKVWLLLPVRLSVAAALATEPALLENTARYRLPFKPVVLLIDSVIVATPL